MIILAKFLALPYIIGEQLHIYHQSASGSMITWLIRNMHRKYEIEDSHEWLWC